MVAPGSSVARRALSVSAMGRWWTRRLAEGSIRFNQIQSGSIRFNQVQARACPSVSFAPLNSRLANAVRLHDAPGRQGGAAEAPDPEEYFAQFSSWRQDRHAGIERLGQDDAAQDHGRRRQEL